jgi:hypothetical protein
VKGAYLRRGVAAAGVIASTIFISPDRTPVLKLDVAIEKLCVSTIMAGFVKNSIARVVAGLQKCAYSATPQENSCCF